jgi:hypothetical protein
MSNPTTPFSWQMPTATDLVTDLPADFEVFGQAVATSMADLLGGTSGQILAKNSNTDMDFVWIANDQGDITGITATSPLTGGGTSGAVTIGILNGTTSNLGAVQLSDSTSSTSTTLAATANAVKTSYDLADAAIAKTTVTTAGDIIYRNATVPTRLGIGTAGQVLQVNSGATAPEWATPAGAAFVGVQATRTNVSTSLTGGTAAAILFPTENFDTNGFHDNSTNTSRITIPTGKGGKYLITLFANTVSVNPSYMILSLYLNGSQYTASGLREGTVFRNDGQIPVSTPTVVTLAAADYLEFYFQQSETATANMYFQFTAIYLGA